MGHATPKRHVTRMDQAHMNQLLCCSVSTRIEYTHTAIDEDEDLENTS